MDNAFIEILEHDISKCEEQIKSGNIKSIRELHVRLKSKYGNIIDGFTDNLRDLFYDENAQYAKENLETMRQKLALFKAMGYENKFAKKDDNIVINNSNQLDVKMNISFSEAKKSITEMSSLQEDEITEIISKIDELEGIIHSKERKTKKWDMAKGIIKWVADKGIDVGITLLPLIMKIGS